MVGQTNILKPFGTIMVQTDILVHHLPCWEPWTTIDYDDSDQSPVSTITYLDGPDL